MHHSLTGREQSPVIDTKRTAAFSRLLNNRGGINRSDSLLRFNFLLSHHFTSFILPPTFNFPLSCLFFSFQMSTSIFVSSESCFFPPLCFSPLTTTREHMKTSGEGDNSWQLPGFEMALEIKRPPLYGAVWLPRRWAGRVSQQHCNSRLNLLPRPREQRLHKHCR